jgi:hypothetical protein
MPKVIACFDDICEICNASKVFIYTLYFKFKVNISILWYQHSRYKLSIVQSLKSYRWALPR